MKKLWLIMLAVALAFGLVFGIAGCRDVPGPVDEATDDWEITDAEEIAKLLTAEGYYGSDTGGCSTDGNVMIFDNVASPDNVGFRLDFPEEAVGYTGLEVTFKLVAVTKLDGTYSAKLGFKSARGSGDVTPYEDHEVILGTAAGGEKTQYFSLNAPNKLPNNLVYINHNQHGSGATGGSRPPVSYKVEITKIVFKAGEIVPCCTDCDTATCRDCVAKACSDECGTVCCLNFDGTETTKVELVSGKVVHTNPPVVAAEGGAVMKADGTVTMNNYSKLFYKFPADTSTIKIADYDYVEIFYTLSNIVNVAPADGTNLKVQMFDYTGTTVYGTTARGGSYQDFGGVGSDSHQIQTWDDNGTGGFAIRMNSWDVKPSGDGTCAEKIDIKITKIEFSKGTRHKVEFYSPMTPNNNNFASIQVLSGNSIGTRGPTPSNPGWTFIGWRDSWEVNENKPAGNVVTNSTAITSDKKLFADWVFMPLPAVTVDAPANGTLFTSKEFAPTFTLGGKTYYVMSVADVTFADLADADFATDDAATITAFKGITASGGSTSRISYNVAGMSSLYNLYSRVRITYDFIPITSVSNTRAVALRNSEGAGGGTDVAGGSWGNDGAPGNATPWLEEGTAKVVSVLPSDLSTGFFGIAKSGAGAFLFRITKIELFL